MFRAFAWDTLTFLNRDATTVLAGLATALAIGGCTASKDIESPTVRDAVAQRYNEPPRQIINASDAEGSDKKTKARKRSFIENDTAPSADERNSTPRFAIATINGRDIARNHISRQMLKNHGIDAFDQLIVLEQAIQRCEELGLSVTDIDVQDEYDRRLKMLLSPLASGSDDSKFNRDEAERILRGILERRDISRLQFLSTIKCNAYLRAIANAQMRFSNADLKREFAEHFGDQVIARHIQLPNRPDTEKLRTMLADGLDFSEAATRHSANLRTGPTGGLLSPFGKGSREIPQSIRSTAFGLEVGEVSAPIQAGPWWHLVKLEKKVANGETNWADVRPELEKRLCEQRIDAQMQGLYRSLHEGADVKINDPVLAQQYAKRQAQRID